MSGRSPWLGNRSSGSVPFGATLSRLGGPAPRSWVGGTADGDAGADTGALPAPGASRSSCGRCNDFADGRADLAQAKVDAIALGRAEGLAETARARDRLAAAAAAITRARAERDHSVTELIIDVALGLCAELAPAAAAIDRRGLAQLVSRALAQAGAGAPGGARDLVLRMCADDVAAVGSQLPSGVVCEVGADLVHGEVWVEAARLVVDGRWAPRLNALREPLVALVRAAEPAFELATDEDTGDGA